MRLILLCVLPIAGALIAGLLPNARARTTASARLALLVGVAVIHAAIVASLWAAPAAPMLGGWRRMRLG
jgi:hypothetical protein